MTGHSTVTGTATAPTLRGRVHQTLFVAPGCGEVRALLAIDAAQGGPPGRPGTPVTLRLWTPVGARVELVEQSAPGAADLTPRRVDAGPQVGLYPTGSWGPEQRDFRIAVEVPPADPGRTRIAARAAFVHVAADGTVTPLDQQHTRRRPDGQEETRAEAWVSATWTADPGAATGRSGPVRRAETEERIAGTIRSAMALLETGADAEAENLLRSARTWAGEIRDAGLVRRIDDLFDPETDTFRAGDLTRGERRGPEIETTHRPVPPEAQP